MPPASQRIYYVNGTHGNDANDGKTSDTAKKTVKGAVYQAIEDQPSWADEATRAFIQLVGGTNLTEAGIPFRPGMEISGAGTNESFWPNIKLPDNALQDALIWDDIQEDIGGDYMHHARLNRVRVGGNNSGAGALIDNIDPVNDVVSIQHPGVTTTLDGAITDTDTTMQVPGTDYPDFPDPKFWSFIITIDSEQIRATDRVNGLTDADRRTWTIERGVNGTAAASHSDGATITFTWMDDKNLDPDEILSIYSRFTDAKAANQAQARSHHVENEDMYLIQPSSDSRTLSGDTTQVTVTKQIKGQGTSDFSPSFSVPTNTALTLNGSHTASTTTIVVNEDISDWPDPDDLGPQALVIEPGTVNEEWVQYDDIDPSVKEFQNCSRGLEGNDVSHADDAPVEYYYGDAGFRDNIHITKAGFGFGMSYVFSKSAPRFNMRCRGQPLTATLWRCDFGEGGGASFYWDGHTGTNSVLNIIGGEWDHGGIVIRNHSPSFTAFRYSKQINLYGLKLEEQGVHKHFTDCIIRILTEIDAPLMLNLNGVMTTSFLQDDENYDNVSDKVANVRHPIILEQSLTGNGQGCVVNLVQVTGNEEQVEVFKSDVTGEDSLDDQMWHKPDNTPPDTTRRQAVVTQASFGPFVRNAFAEMAASGSAASQSLTSDTTTKIDQFDTAGESRNATINTGSNQIEFTQHGLYEVFYQVSFSGGAGVLHTFQPFLDGTAVTGMKAVETASGSISSQGVIRITDPTNVEIDLRVTVDGGSTFDVQAAQLTIRQIKE